MLLPQDNQQIERDQKLLLRLMLQPIRKPTRWQKLIEFFSHPVWQSIGAILGILSLVVTVVLTVSIYQLAREQDAFIREQERQEEMGELDYLIREVAPSEETSTKYISHWRIAIINTGPATARDVAVDLTSGSDMDCEAYNPGLERVSPVKITRTEFGCQLLYSNIYPYYDAIIHVTHKRNKSDNDSFISYRDVIIFSVIGSNVGQIKEGFDLIELQEDT